MAAFLGPCTVCFDQANQRQVGCGSCGGTGLAGAHYCSGCAFIHPDKELVGGSCAVCRSAQAGKKSRRG